MAADSGTYDEATLARQKIAAALTQGYLKPEENIKHWSQGLANMAKAGIGGFMGYQAGEDQKAERATERADLYTALGLPAPAAAPSSPNGFQQIAALLSGGSGSAPASPAAAPVIPPEPVAAPPVVPAPTPPPPPTPHPPPPAGPRGGDVPAPTPTPTPSPMPSPKMPAVAAAMSPPGAAVLPVPAATPAVNAPRAEVMPSAKVWGDKEAEDAGLYEPSGKKVAAAMTPAPMPTDVSAVAKPAVAPPAAAVPPAAVPAAAPASSGVLANVPQEKKAQLAAMLTSRNPTVKALAMQEIGNYTKADTPTDEMREYNLDATQRKAQGLPPRNFFDFKSDLKKAGAVNVTTNVDKGEDSFAKAAGSAQAKRYDELAEGGQQAKQMVSDINTLTDLGKNIGTGKVAEFKSAIGPYADALGVKVNGLSDIQAYEAIVNRVAPSLRVKGSGAQSDLELKNFLKSLPSLGNTPEGNELAATTIKGLQENKIKAAEIGSKALTGEITRADAEKQLRELPDPMENYRAYTKKRGATPEAASEEGWKDLGGGVRIREKK